MSGILEFDIKFIKLHISMKNKKIAIDSQCSRKTHNFLYTKF